MCGAGALHANPASKRLHSGAARAYSAATNGDTACA
jgi:hypothetical protein